MTANSTTGRRELDAASVIIRAQWCRGAEQREALRELRWRGLWLTPHQEAKAGLRLVWRCYRAGREFGIDYPSLYDARQALRSFVEVWGAGGYYIRQTFAVVRP